MLYVDCDGRFIHDPVVHSFEPVIKEAYHLMQVVDPGARQPHVRKDVCPWSNQKLLWTSQMFKHPQVGVAPSVLPATKDEYGACNCGVIFAQRALLPV